MSEPKMPTYGGQAVIEGVMMRGKHAVAIAMRAPNHEIVLHTEPLGSIYSSNITKIPFLRGMVVLWDALGLGMKALTISANTQTEEETKLEGPALYISLFFSLAFGIALFFLGPAAVGHLVEQSLNVNPWWSNLAEGIMRLGLLVLYIWAIGFIPDIRRVFSYHGAEHKTINAFEAEAELTPESVARFPLQHPRCGTAFLLVLVLLSIILFSFIGPLPMFWRLASRVLMLPVLAGVAYEYIRWTANHLNHAFVRLLVKPSLALQNLTTREPSLEMLEVSIAAFNAMRAGEQRIQL